jgi:hypothetical protein
MATSSDPLSISALRPSNCWRACSSNGDSSSRISLGPPVLVFVGGVDQDQAGHLLRAAGGVQANQQPSEGVADQHIGPRELGGNRQGVQLLDHHHRGAALALAGQVEAVPAHINQLSDRVGCGRP